MRVKSFLKLVEIQTKAASVIPFLLGTSYALYKFGSFKPINYLLMLVSLLCIDMATTAINNYFDYKRANRKYGFGYESHNAIVRDNLKEPAVLAVIFVLLAAAVTTGFILFINTNIVVLLLGAASFATGIVYSFGPVPISRTPLGELFSGAFMGLAIPFISVYIHVYDGNLLTLKLNNGILSAGADLAGLLSIFLASMPAAAGIANIMLANNICDIEDDLENKRYTLPVYIGKDRSLLLFEALYGAGFLSYAVLLVIGGAPLVSAVMLTALIPVYRNIKRFKAEQSKKNTFGLSVMNFVIINILLVLSITAAVVIPALH